MLRLPSVAAINSAAASGNPLHDRERARALGHKDALVSGADTVAILADVAVAHCGAQWLDNGLLDCELLKPIYDGDVCDLSATKTRDTDIAIALHVDNELRATASCALRPGVRVPALDHIPYIARTPERSVPLTPDQLPTGRVLPTIEDRPDPALQGDLRDQSGNRSPIYAGGQWLHPYVLVKLAIGTLAHNFVPEVLIHLGTRLQNFQPIGTAARLEARSRVLANYETRGHKAVCLDIVILADGLISASARHRMIYRLREPTKA